MVKLSHYKHSSWEMMLQSNVSQQKNILATQWFGINRKLDRSLVLIALSYNYWNNIQFENEFKDGRFDISASEDSFHLNITATTKEDIGQYFCGTVS